MGARRAIVLRLSRGNASVSDLASPLDMSLAAVVQHVQALEASAGSWRGRDFTGSEYVNSVRGDLDERLSRLGFE